MLVTGSVQAAPSVSHPGTLTEGGASRPFICVTWSEEVVNNEPQESLLNHGRREVIRLQNWDLYKFLKDHKEMLVFTVSWHSLSPLCILSSFRKKGQTNI